MNNLLIKFLMLVLFLLPSISTAQKVGTKNDRKKIIAAIKANNIKQLTNAVTAAGGANVRLGKYLATPMLEAAFYGNTTAYLTLFRMKADFRHRDKSGDNALNYAVLGGQAAMIEFLLDGGEFDVNDKRMPALITAGYNGLPKSIFQLLIKRGARVQSTRTITGVPLLIAAAVSKKTKVEVFKLLLENGADPNATNKKGNKASEFAKKPAVKKLLLAAEKSKYYAKIRDFVSFKGLAAFAKKFGKKNAMSKYLAVKCTDKALKHHCTVIRNYLNYSGRTGFGKIGLAGLYTPMLMIEADTGKSPHDITKFTKTFDSVYRGTNPYVFGFLKKCSDNKSGIYSTLQMKYKSKVKKYSKKTLVKIHEYFDNKYETCDKTGFRLHAVGDLNDDGKLDVWTLNRKKELRHLFKGYPEPLF